MIFVKFPLRSTPLCVAIGFASVLGSSAEPQNRYGADRNLGHEVNSIKRELDATTGRVSKLEGQVKTIHSSGAASGGQISYSGNSSNIPAATSKHSGSGQYHRVQTGETLSSIARSHQVGVDRLVAENHITNPNTLKIGQEIYIPGRKGSTASTPPAPNGGAAKPSAASGKTSSYTVRSGDTLSSIARRYGITSTTIARANGISDPRMLAAGQKLDIPSGAGSAHAQGAAKKSAPPAPAPKASRNDEVIAPDGHGFYQVEKGDTLHSIAISFGTNTSELRRLNELRGDSLHIGDFLLVPVPDESLYES